MKAEIDNRFHLNSSTAAAVPLSATLLSRPVQIERLDGPADDCARLLDLGFTPGETIVVTQAAPLGDPLIIRVRDALLALRKREAAWIMVRQSR